MSEKIKFKAKAVYNMEVDREYSIIFTDSHVYFILESRQDPNAILWGQLGLLGLLINKLTKKDEMPRTDTSGTLEEQLRGNIMNFKEPLENIVSAVLTAPGRWFASHGKHKGRLIMEFKDKKLILEIATLDTMNKIYNQLGRVLYGKFSPNVIFDGVKYTNLL